MSAAPSSCLLCGAANDCGAAAGRETCWCWSAEIPGALVRYLASRGLADACLCARCAAGDVPSPCIGLCRLDATSSLCLGCQRTPAEIAAWPSLDAVGRAAIRLRLRDGAARRD